MKFFEHFFHRIHESIALSAFLSASFTLHLAWIRNLLVHKISFFRDLLNIVPSVGPVSGLYLTTVISFLLLFGIFVLFFKGRDCSVWRGRVFGFFYISVVMFLVFTLPAVYEFSVSVE